MVSVIYPGKGNAPGYSLFPNNYVFDDDVNIHTHTHTGLISLRS